MVVTTKITHRYLMNKTKWDLVSWIMDDLDRIDKLTDELEAVKAEKDMLRIAVGKHNQEKDQYNAEFSALQDEYNFEVETVTALGAYLDQAHKDVEQMTGERSVIFLALAEAFDVTPDYPDFEDAAHLKEFIIGRLNTYRSIIDEKAATIKLWEEAHQKRRINAWSPWIACAERMPERGQVVLMWIQPHSYIPGNAKEGAYMPQINMVTPWRSTWDMAVYSEEDITHWQPMPERPEVQP